MFDGIYTPGCVCSYCNASPGLDYPPYFEDKDRSIHIISFTLANSFIPSKDPIVLGPAEIVILAGFNFVVFQQTVCLDTRAPMLIAPDNT